MREELTKSREFLRAVLRQEIINEGDFQPFSTLDLNTTKAWTDAEMIVFWVNVYNAQAQLLLNDKGNQINKRVFATKSIEFAGKKLSLDDIEHGILRRGKWKKGFGYLPGYFDLRSYFLENAEPRIHFLLNCAAESCPIIRIMEVDTLDQVLSEAEEDFVKETSQFIEDKLSVSSLFLFYWGDFGGSIGVRSLLQNYFDQPVKRLRFQRFSWKPRYAKMTYEK